MQPKQRNTTNRSIRTRRRHSGEYIQMEIMEATTRSSNGLLRYHKPEDKKAALLAHVGEKILSIDENG